MSIGHVEKKCMGCRACEQVCPAGCITFRESDEGFLYPHMDELSCIKCDKCETVCPAIRQPYQSGNARVLAGWNLNEQVLGRSSSGGIFSLAAEEIIRRDGIVYGCVFNKDLMAEHMGIRSQEQLPGMRGSKYVESSINYAYTEVREHLHRGEHVLFTGTPCQCAGLRNYLGRDYDRLYVIDIICHGVPSRKMFSEYIRRTEEKHKGKVVSFEFRSKQKHGWSLTYMYRVKKKNRIRQYEGIASLSSYYYGFLAGFMYRESCYQCPYACEKRVGDMTLGDFWGVEKQSPENYNRMGVSAVLVNSSKGEALADSIKDRMHWDEISFEMAAAQNDNLLHPTGRSDVRAVIYNDLNTYGYSGLEGRYLKAPCLAMEKLKSCIPNEVRQKIKRWVRRPMGMAPRV